MLLKIRFYQTEMLLAYVLELLRACNVHTVLVLPAKVFTAGVQTVVLFFEKGSPTKKVWFYQLNLDRNLGKKNPLNENDLADLY